MANAARVLGVHPIVADEPVHLVEIEIVGNVDAFDFNDITQEVPGKPRNNWQAAYDEQQIAEEPGRVRYAFFFHTLDLSKPLQSSFGSLKLPAESPLPDHLQKIEYEQP